MDDLDEKLEAAGAAAAAYLNMADVDGWDSQAEYEFDRRHHCVECEVAIVIEHVRAELSK